MASGHVKVPHQQAEHMAAPTSTASTSNKSLANREPSTQGYYLIWFVRGRWSGGPELLTEFPSLEAWETRVDDIGHGTPTEMTAAEALDVARAAEPAPPLADPTDPQSLAGRRVAVVPDVDGGDPEVTGLVHGCDRESIAIRHENPRIGHVSVHFPRVGYRVTLVEDT